MAVMVIGLDDGTEYILPWSFGENDDADMAASMALSHFRGQIVHASIQSEQEWLVPKSLTLRDHERIMVIEALRVAGWCQKDAAELLGITPRQVCHKITKHKINSPPGHGWRKAR